jgi:hypothetical protein
MTDTEEKRSEKILYLFLKNTSEVYELKQKFIKFNLKSKSQLLIIMIYSTSYIEGVQREDGFIE